MKKDLLNFVAVLGFVLLGAVVVIGLLAGVLFIFPNSSIFGARAVKGRDTQIVYQDAQLADVFANGKFILESTGTHVEVKVSSEGYKEEGAIVVNESASGIAFNSLNRTLIQWSQTIYGENKDVYYRIKVLEPNGLVFSNKPTTVYINLPHRDDNFKYSFVLQNRYSPVNFSFVNDTETNADHLLIDKLVVESAASVTIPYTKKSSIDEVVVKSKKATIECKANVKGNVFIYGENNTLNFGEDESSGIEGNVTIKGNHNNFTGTTAKKVTVEQKDGACELKMTHAIESLDAEVNSGSIEVDKVTGTTNINTVSADFSANELCGLLNYVAGTPDNANGTANLTVSKITGRSVIENYGLGSVSLKDVDAEVKIDSHQVGAADIDVAFAENASGHKVDILGYDGNISLTGVNGGTVTVTIYGKHNRAGYANVDAQFNQVGDVKIVTGAYPSGHEDLGNVRVTLGETCNDLDLYVFNARSANCAEKYRSNCTLKWAQHQSGEEYDYARSHNIIAMGQGSSAVPGRMEIDTQNKFELA